MILYTIIALEQVQEALDAMDNTKFMMIKKSKVKTPLKKLGENEKEGRRVLNYIVTG